MKVICIKENQWEHYSGNKSTDKDPKYGEFCTVIDTANLPVGLYYVLGEYLGCMYNSNWFIPLDEYLNQYTESLTKELENLELIEK